MNAQATITEEINHYLATGSSDPVAGAWPGDGVVDRCKRADRDLRNALIAELRRRVSHLPSMNVPVIDAAGHCRSILAPMIEGLFLAAERAAVIDLLVRAIVFVASDNVVEILRTEPFAHNAWTVANLYLRSFGAAMLSDDAPAVLGLCTGQRCYVALDYFRNEGDGFADFVIHEAAHVFHSCKRRQLGFRERRNEPWLLPIAFSEQENFAYSCEAYACIERRAKGRAARLALADEFTREFRPSDHRVVREKVCSVIQQAAGARNGWRVILQQCRYRA